MPWCPVCKNEYREGITVCADCKVDLVMELTGDPKDQNEFLAALEQEEDAKKLVSYLEYSGISAYYEPKEKDSAYSVYVPKKDYKKAKKAFGAFYTVELTAEYEKTLKQMIDTENEQSSSAKSAGADEELSDQTELSDSEEETDSSCSDDLPENLREEIEKALSSAGHSSYVTKAEKSADYRSSAVTFTGFGIIGLIVMVLHWAGVFSYFSTVSSVILTIMFVVFLVIGIDSFQRAGKAKTEAAEEERFVKELTEWLEGNLTFDMLAAADQAGLSKEANFLNEIAELKRIITKQFGDLEPAFLEQFTEDYYNNHFE